MVMERTAGETGALGEAVVFLDYFKDLPDPRQRGKVLYPLDEVLLFCLLAVLAGSEAITDIARFGEKKLELLRRFRPFRDGTPSHPLRSRPAELGSTRRQYHRGHCRRWVWPVGQADRILAPGGAAVDQNSERCTHLRCSSNLEG